MPRTPAATAPAPALPPQLGALLAPGEKVLWHAQPRPAVFVLRGLPNITYGITWSVLGAFWYHGAGGLGRYSAFEGWWRLTPLFSFPFIIAGFSFFFYPIRLGARARRTWYVVTNRRVLTLELPPRKPPQLEVFREENLAALTIRKHSGGWYDVLLAPRAIENPHLQPRLEDGFFGLENGEEAAAAIRGRSSFL
jgi:hypothetical protein